MPKETINYPKPEIPGGATAPAVALHWRTNEDTPHLSFSVDVGLMEHTLAARDQGMLKNSSAGEGRVIIHTAALSRDELQRLIKFARRARDAAYGADA